MDQAPACDVWPQALLKFCSNKLVYFEEVVMTPSLLASLAVKSTTTAAIVLVASFVARRAGAFWGAVTASLPVSVGPAYLFLALQHDVDFLETTHQSTIFFKELTIFFLGC